MEQIVSGAKFVLTEEGWKAYARMERNYYTELAELRCERNEPDYCEGWCIIDNFKYIKNIDDEVDLLIFGYAEDVYGVIADWVNTMGEDLDEPYWKGADFTLRDVCNRIRERGLLRWAS